MPRDTRLYAVITRQPATLASIENYFFYCFCAPSFGKNFPHLSVSIYSLIHRKISVQVKISVNFSVQGAFVFYAKCYISNKRHG